MENIENKENQEEIKEESVHNSSNEPVKEKKAKKNHSGLKIILASVLLSSATGFGSAALAIKLFANTPTVVYESSNSPIINQTSNIETGNTVSAVASAVENSVVEIRTEQIVTSNWLQQYVSEGAGSGVVYSSDGYIVTNNHVIDGATNITVTMHDGSTYPAELIATDSKTDLALLKIEKSDCIPVVLGNSDELIVGDATIAVGNPLGQLGGTVTNGIISALDREITLDGRTHNLLQTNAAINPGNSGGGLFNASGELIGIVVAKSSGSDVEGLGFAIPVNDVKEVIEQLLTNGYVSGRPAMGISVVSVETYQQAISYGVNKYGVFIVEVLEDSAAEKAGLQANDYIVSVDGVAIESYDDLSGALDNYAVGDTITIQIQRGRNIMDFSLTLQENTNQQ